MTTKTYEISAGRLDAHDTRAEHETLTSTLAATRGELRRVKDELARAAPMLDAVQNKALRDQEMTEALSATVREVHNMLNGKVPEHGGIVARVGALIDTYAALPSTEAAVRAGIEAGEHRYRGRLRQ